MLGRKPQMKLSLKEQSPQSQAGSCARAPQIPPTPPGPTGFQEGRELGTVERASWHRGGDQQDCSGERSERLLPATVQSRGREPCVAWTREEGNGDSKSIKGLATDLQRLGVEGDILASYPGDWQVSCGVYSQRKLLSQAPRRTGWDGGPGKW